MQRPTHEAVRLTRTLFAALRSRPAAAVLLVYQALFLNVLLPGHTRGAVTLDGKHTPACCCEGDPRPTERVPAVPSRRDRDHCAICQFAAGLTPLLFFRITLADHGLLQRSPAAPPPTACSLDRIPTYLACGPPLSPARV